MSLGLEQPLLELAQTQWHLGETPTQDVGLGRGLIGRVGIGPDDLVGSTVARAIGSVVLSSHHDLRAATYTPRADRAMTNALV
jgi:hypothetical protein